MKIFAFVFGVLIASACSLPQQGSDTELAFAEQRLVTDAISSAIEDVSQNIRDAGLDPLYIEREDYSYDLPVPAILTSSAHLEDVRSNGLSNIVINNLNFGVITTRLTFDIALPRIDASLGSAAAEANVFGRKFDGQASGRVSVLNVRVRGSVRVSVGIISGISIRDLTINFTLGGIESNVSVNLLGTDMSSQVNTFLSATIPATLLEYSSEINQLLEIIALDILNDIL